MIDAYKSPQKKLVVFFRDSRDSWKSKFQELKIKHRNLQRKHDYTIDKMATLKEQLSTAKSELLSAQKRLKKTTSTTRV